YESAFIHDKPVLGDGGHMLKSRQFVSYLRFGVGRKELSDQLLKLLGTFDYKYVVVPDYASYKEGGKHESLHSYCAALAY
ncbi:unnamed protein product, partial [marine sediment metagenome]